MRTTRPEVGDQRPEVSTPALTCTKCGNEPRVPGQRWGLQCRALWAEKRRAAVPHETSGTPLGRNERRRRLDDWLKENRGRVEKESTTAIAIELRRLGFYSANTSVIDIRVGVSKRCGALGLLYPGKLFTS